MKCEIAWISKTWSGHKLCWPMAHTYGKFKRIHFSVHIFSQVSPLKTHRRAHTYIHPSITRFSNSKTCYRIFSVFMSKVWMDKRLQSSRKWGLSRTGPVGMCRPISSHCKRLPPSLHLAVVSCFMAATIVPVSKIPRQQSPATWALQHSHMNNQEKLVIAFVIAILPRTYIHFSLHISTLNQIHKNT